MSTHPPRIDLRPYQHEAILRARAAFADGARAILLVLPTGAGKTVVFAEMIRLTHEKAQRAGKHARSLVLVHRNELLEQASRRIAAAAPDLLVEPEAAARSASSAADVVVASVQTLARQKRLGRWARESFRLIVVDEAHHATAESYRRVLRHFSTARVLGVTATPDRADGVALGEVFERTAFKLEMLDGIHGGWLAPVRASVIRLEALDLDGVSVSKDGRGKGDFVEDELANALAANGVLEAVTKELRMHVADRSTLVFVAGVLNARRLAALLLEAGEPAASVDATTPAEERAALFERFNAGELRYLVNVGIATEGTDLPRCSCVAVARPTKSRSLFTQMVGRGVRLFPGKADCLLLNFIPSNARHRLIGPVDALAPGVDVVTIDRAHELMCQRPELSPDEALELARQEEPERERERALERYRANRVAYDPFEVLDAQLELEGALRIDVDDEPTRDFVSVDHLVERGVPRDVAERMSLGERVVYGRAIDRRRRDGLSSFKQAKRLRAAGLNPDVTFELARHAMELLAKNGWRAPRELRADPRFAVPRPPEPAGAEVQREPVRAEGEAA